MAKKGSRIPKPVWRSIVRKNERQPGGLFDVLVCKHAVPANSNTYRRARACPECAVFVEQERVRRSSAVS